MLRSWGAVKHAFRHLAFWMSELGVEVPRSSVTIIRQVCPETGRDLNAPTSRRRTLALLSNFEESTMPDPADVPEKSPRVAWNKGKRIGAKPPLSPKHVWSIRMRLHSLRRTKATLISSHWKF